jgi:hypothetical protein
VFDTQLLILSYVFCHIADNTGSEKLQASTCRVRYYTVPAVGRSPVASPSATQKGFDVAPSRHVAEAFQPRRPAEPTNAPSSTAPLRLRRGARGSGGEV